jgi:hypothetical protein
MSRCLAALASAFCLAACSVPGTVQARAFTTGFKVGQTIRYNVHTTVTGSLSIGGQQLPLNSDQTLAEKLEVKSVDGAGNATIDVIAEDRIDAATGGGATLKPAPVRLVIGSDGRIRSGATAQPGGRVPSIPGSDQLTPILPGKAVKPGDSWDRRYDRLNPYGPGGFSFTSHNRYLKDEAVGDRQAAVIESTVGGPIDFTIDFSKLPNPAAKPPSVPAQSPVHYTGAISSTTRYWVDLSSNEVLKASGSGTYTLAYSVAPAAGQASGPQQVNFNGRIKTDLTRLQPVAP